MAFETRKPIIRRLPVRLTDFELLHYARQNAQASDELNAIEHRRKQLADECKSKLSGIAMEVSRRNTAINTGEEPREVECYEETDAKAGKARLIRCDLGSVVSERPMTSDEYQTTIELFTDSAEAE
jgi:hypothetical protein